MNSPHRLIPLLVTCLLAACGSHSPIEKIEPTELQEFTAERDVKVLWTRDTGSAVKEFLRLMPALDAGVLYVADHGGRVTAVESSTGKEKWSINLDLSVTGATAAGDGVVVVADRLGQVVALEQADGKERWRAKVSSQVLAPALISSSMVLVQSQDGRLHGLDAQDGSVRWVYTTTVPALSLHGTSKPVGVLNAVATGFANGRVVAVDMKNGRLLWEHAVSTPRGRNEIERLVDVDSPIRVVGDMLVAASYQGKVIAVSQRTGAILWAREVSTYNAIDADRRSIFLTDEEGTVLAFDQGTGASRWKQDKLRGRRLNAPVVVDEMVVVGDLEGYVHWLSAEDGRLIARYHIGGGAIHAPGIVDGDRIFMLSLGGELAALRAVRKN
jgi:outer membrane protein assembly factor BamB